ncbi:MAG: pilus assembly PilX N-terminal domain-containing protein [Candidatus Moraniibacteriota bacterium]
MFRKAVCLKGSTLVFSLIVLAFLLVSAISLATVAVTEKRASLATAKSNLSFQAADSGAEAVLAGIKEGDADNAAIPPPADPKVSIEDFFSGCNSDDVVTGGDTNSGTYEVTFYTDDTGPALACSDARADIVRIISKGFYANTTRAIEVGIPPVPLPAP